MHLRDSVVIVTGASRGIGRAIADRLAAEGSLLVLVARSAGGGGQGQGEGEGDGPAPRWVTGDVVDPDTARKAVAAALESFGRLDAVINNAGLGLRAPVWRIAPEDLRYVLDVNLIGPLNFIRAAVPPMVERGRGLIVNVSSAVARRPVPSLGGYAATKAALLSLSETLRMELSGTGVEVLSVLPGSVETGFKSAARGEPYPERPGAVRLEPTDVADRVVRAMAAGRREVAVLSRSERLALLAGRVAPGLVEKALLRRYGGGGSPGDGPGQGV
ncbi:MAG: SDR family NAD(P)-dependent oxidoreductase [Bacillota bacterium]